MQPGLVRPVRQPPNHCGYSLLDLLQFALYWRTNGAPHAGSSVLKRAVCHCWCPCSCSLVCGRPSLHALPQHVSCGSSPSSSSAGNAVFGVGTGTEKLRQLSAPEDLVPRLLYLTLPDVDTTITTVSYYPGVILLQVFILTRSVLLTDCSGAAGTAMWHKSYGSASCFMGHRITMRKGAEVQGMALFSNVTS